MKRVIIILALACIAYVSAVPSYAQIKTKRHYDFIDNETNSENLRKVGINGKYGCIDNEGNEVVDVIYKDIVYYESCNLIKVKVRTDYRDKYGLLTADGKYTVAHSKYDYINVDTYAFNKHRCFIFGIFNSSDWRYGLVNDRDEEIVPEIYEDLQWLDKERGYLRAELNNHYGIIDISGKFILEPKYDNLPICHYGDTIVARIKNQVVMINLSDEKIINTISNDASYLYSRENSFVIEEESRNRYILYSILNKTPKTLPGIKPTKFDCRTNFDDIYYFIVKGSYKKKYVDDLGRVYDDSDKAKQANEEIKRQIEVELEKKKKMAPEENKLASVTWTNHTGSTNLSVYQLQLGIKSDSKIEEVGITVNGVVTRGINTVESSEYDMSITQEVHLNEGTNVIKVSVRNAAGTAQEEKTVVYSPVGEGLPTIEWLEVANKSESRDIEVKIGIKSKTAIDDVNFTVNGSASRGINTVPSTDYDMVINQTLTLADGINRIVASARNAEGITTSEKVITYKDVKPTPVVNDRRVALVVGNSKYKFNALSNPSNDARCVAEKLKTLGFDVILKLDANLEDMDSLINNFGDKAKDCDVALFYYAGHGVQSNGVNYLLPISVDNTLRESELKYKTTDVDFILSTLEASQCKLKMVILDACRNNPLPRSWNRGTGLRGLSILEAPSGTIISFATSPGKTAKDDTEANTRNSPYANAFLKALDTPNLDVFHFFQQVGSDVQHSTKGEQVPWLSTSFTGEFYFNQQ